MSLGTQRSGLELAEEIEVFPQVVDEPPAAGAARIAPPSAKVSRQNRATRADRGRLPRPLLPGRSGRRTGSRSDHRRMTPGLRYLHAAGITSGPTPSPSSTPISREPRGDLRGAERENTVSVQRVPVESRHGHVVRTRAWSTFLLDEITGARAAISRSKRTVSRSSKTQTLVLAGRRADLGRDPRLGFSVTGGSARPER